MNRFLLIIILSIFAQNSNAQTYVPFPTAVDTAVWFVSSSTPTFGTGYYNIISYGDTIFDGLTYTKIYRGNNVSIGRYYAAIREENKVIYLRSLVPSNGPSLINSDTILFDFNVQVGDTVNWFSYFGNNIGVHSIDSIQVADGTYRKRFRLGSVEVIEGIGSSYGFIPSPLIGGGGISTYCYFLNDDFIWSNWDATANDCYTSTKQLKLNSNIKVFPNPASDVLNIDFENYKQKELTIYNQLGEVVINQISNETNLVLDLKSLAKGFYILAIQTEAGRFTKKIIKH